MCSSKEMLSRLKKARIQKAGYGGKNLKIHSRPIYSPPFFLKGRLWGVCVCVCLCWRGPNKQLQQGKTKPFTKECTEKMVAIWKNKGAQGHMPWGCCSLQSSIFRLDLFTEKQVNASLLKSLSSSSNSYFKSDSVLFPKPLFSVSFLI